VRFFYNQVPPRSVGGAHASGDVCVIGAKVSSAGAGTSREHVGARWQGNFRWKKHDVFLTEVLWGEEVGLLPEDGRRFTIYFAHYASARFASQQLRVTPLAKAGEPTKSLQGQWTRPLPFPPSPLIKEEQQRSGMCPV